MLAHPKMKIVKITSRHSIQTHKTFAHFGNTIEDINET